MSTGLVERLEAAGGTFSAIHAWDLVPLAGFGTSGYRADLLAAALQGSLDAAVELAELALPPDPAFRPLTPSVGWKITVYRGMIPAADKGGWFANVRRHASDGVIAAAPTPALALCIAILRALQTDSSGDEP